MQTRDARSRHDRSIGTAERRLDGPDVQLVTARAADGLVLHGALARADHPEAILVVHGAWGNFYATPGAVFLEAGPPAGLTTLSMNSRAHDLGTLHGHGFDGFVRHSFTECTLDVDAAAQVLRDEGVERFVVLAHSYGSHVACRWARDGDTTGLAGLFLPSPGPRLSGTDRWFVDGSLPHHVARAASAVAAGDPHRLLVLSSDAPVPMVAEAATVLETWGPDSPADSEDYVADLAVPVQVTVGGREPGIYRDYAAQVADAAGSELLVLDDDHYYQHHPAAFVDAVLSWIRDATELQDVSQR